MTDADLLGYRRSNAARFDGWKIEQDGSDPSWSAISYKRQAAIFRPSFEQILDAIELHDPPELGTITAEEGSGDSIDSSRVRK